MPNKLGYDTDAVFRDLTGNTIDWPTSKKPGPDGNLPTEDLTVRTILIEALTAPTESDKDATSNEESLKRYDLARKIAQGGMVEIKPSELKLLEPARIFHRWNTQIDGWMRDFLEDPQPIKPSKKAA